MSAHVPQPVAIPSAAELRRWRERLGLTQVTAAAEIGFNVRTYQRLEHGVSEVPRMVALACEVIRRRRDDHWYDASYPFTAAELRRWREALGLTQVAAAAEIGFSARTYQRIEHGVLNMPRRVALACEAIRRRRRGDCRFNPFRPCEG